MPLPVMNHSSPYCCKLDPVGKLVDEVIPELLSELVFIILQRGECVGTQLCSVDTFGISVALPVKDDEQHRGRRLARITKIERILGPDL